MPVKTEILRELWLIGVSAGVGGKTRTTEIVNSNRTAEGGKEIEKKIEEQTAHERSFRDGEKIVGQLRANLRKYAVNVDGTGWVCSPENKVAFEAAIARGMVDVRRHNSTIPYGFSEQPCKITGPSGRGLPIAKTKAIGILFGPEDFSEVLTLVTDGLTEGIALLNAGKFEACMQWVKLARPLAGLVPSLNSNFVGDAIEAIRCARNEAAKRARDLALTDAIERGDANAIAQALDVPEVLAARDAVTTALGWVVPATEEQGAASVG